MSEDLVLRKLISFLIIAAFVLVGCTHLSGLSAPSKSSHFILEKDLYKVTRKGAYRWKHVFVLRSGKYTLIGENKDGYFYRGDVDDSVAILTNARAEKYLESGDIPAYEDRFRQQMSIAGGEGGLWIPKDGVDKRPRLFYVIRINPDLGVTQAAQYSTVGQASPLGVHQTQMVAGGVISMVNSYADKSIAYEPFDEVLSSGPALKMVDE